MAQKIYGVTKYCGDGTAVIVWFKDLKALNYERDHNDAFNMAESYETLTFPDDLDLSKCGFHFYERNED